MNNSSSMFKNSGIKREVGSHHTLIKQGLFDQRTVPMACIYICPGLYKSAILFLNFVFDFWISHSLQGFWHVPKSGSEKSVLECFWHYFRGKKVGRHGHWRPRTQRIFRATYVRLAKRHQLHHKRVNYLLPSTTRPSFFWIFIRDFFCLQSPPGLPHLWEDWIVHRSERSLILEVVVLPVFPWRRDWLDRDFDDRLC